MASSGRIQASESASEGEDSFGANLERIISFEAAVEAMLGVRSTLNTEACRTFVNTDLESESGFERIGAHEQNAFNSSDIPRLRRRIAYELARHGLEHEAEDCAQDYFVHLLSGKGHGQTVGQFVIDYLRKRTGRKGSPGFTQRLALVHSVQLNEAGVDRSMRYDPRDSMDDRLAVTRVAGLLSARERRIVELYCLKDMLMSEIAAKLGVSEAMVSIVLSRLPAKLRERSVKQTDRKAKRHLKLVTKLGERD